MSRENVDCAYRLARRHPCVLGRDRRVDRARTLATAQGARHRKGSERCVGSSSAEALRAWGCAAQFVPSATFPRERSMVGSELALRSERRPKPVCRRKRLWRGRGDGAKANSVLCGVSALRRIGECALPERRVGRAVGDGPPGKMSSEPQRPALVPRMNDRRGLPSLNRIAPNKLRAGGAQFASEWVARPCALTELEAMSDV
jgi:hypothetical protein